MEVLVREISVKDFGHRALQAHDLATAVIVPLFSI